MGDRIETINSVEFASLFGSAEMPVVVFAEAPIEAGPKGPNQMSSMPLSI
jgi:hypothetical protein